MAKKKKSKAKAPKKAKPHSSKKPKAKKKKKASKKKVKAFEEVVSPTVEPTVQPDVVAENPPVESVQSAGMISQANVEVPAPSEEMKAYANSLNAIIASHRNPMRKDEVVDFMAKNSQMYRAVANFTPTGYTVKISNGLTSFSIPATGEYLFAK